MKKNILQSMVILHICVLSCVIQASDTSISTDDIRSRAQNLFDQYSGPAAAAADVFDQDSGPGIASPEIYTISRNHPIEEEASDRLNELLEALYNYDQLKRKVYSQFKKTLFEHDPKKVQEYIIKIGNLYTQIKSYNLPSYNTDLDLAMHSLESANEPLYVKVQEYLEKHNSL